MSGTQNELLYSVVAALERGTQREALAFIDAVTDFCVENENEKVFGGWGRETIRLLVAYHLAKGTLITQVREGKITAMFMWYRLNESDGWEFIHEWKPDRPEGDSLFLAFLHATDNASFRQIVLDFLQQEPLARSLKLFGSRLRNGVSTRVRYTPRLFTKILNSPLSSHG